MWFWRYNWSRLAGVFEHKKVANAINVREDLFKLRPCVRGGETKTYTRCCDRSGREANDDNSNARF